MNAKQKRVLQSLRRAQNWLAARPEFVASAPALGAQTAELGAAVQLATSFVAEQEKQRRGSKGSTADASKRRTELLDQHVRPVADMAKKVMPDVVRMTETLRRPKAHLDAESLLGAAEAMAKASTEFTDVLVQHGLPTDFVAQLDGAAKAYRGAIDAGGEARGARRGATTGLQESLGRARNIVDRLSVLIHRDLRSDSPALAEWEQVTRVTIKGVQPAVAASTTPAATVPATVAPAEQQAA